MSGAGAPAADLPLRGAGRGLGDVVRDLWADPGQTPAFIAIHLGCLLVLVTGAPWDAVLVGAASYVLRCLGISAGYHRYFAHRSFRTSRGMQCLLALLGTLAMQKGVLWWVAHHRRHHRLADRAGDVHSPHRGGFWWAHLGWFLARGHAATDWRLVRDWARYPELVWLNRYFAIPPLLFTVGLYAAGGLSWVVWGFFITTVVSLHVTCAVNSIGHSRGSRPYDTPDHSRNNLWLALVGFGEGWHNNHHHDSRSARLGVRRGELDPTHAVLVALARAGLVWDLVPPADVTRLRAAGDGLAAPRTSPPDG